MLESNSNCKFQLECVKECLKDNYLPRFTEVYKRHYINLWLWYILHLKVFHAQQLEYFLQVYTTYTFQLLQSYNRVNKARIKCINNKNINKQYATSLPLQQCQPLNHWLLKRFSIFHKYQTQQNCKILLKTVKPR